MRTEREQTIHRRRAAMPGVGEKEKMAEEMMPAEEGEDAGRAATPLLVVEEGERPLRSRAIASTIGQMRWLRGCSA